MQTADLTIDDLRREIDEIDTRLHDLLMRRSGVVAEIGALKGNTGEAAGNGFFRPGREAVILRRLMQRHSGTLPRATVVRMWRELLGATLRQQGPLAIAVYAPNNRPGYWDIARDHFGSLTPATAHETIGQVMRAVMEEPVTLGVLPLPQADDVEPWWPYLLGIDPRQPRVIARLPFGAGAVLRGGAVEALVIGRIAQEETGGDRSLFVIESSAEMSRSGLRAALKEAALSPLFIHIRRDRNDPTTWFHLIEVEGCLKADDPRLARLAADRPEDIRRVWPLGGYAVPFTAAELGA
jgi:chorismate mutase-like protein